ncbi:MAG: type I-D CRISPR-associated protein Csc2 [Deltaproteobacteria bacterium]|nr:type I-D CRISPR-associated protein Csc2 [Deltaproteobacteria bacterium]
MSEIESFVRQMAAVEELLPRVVNKRRVPHPIYTRRVVTIAGLKTAKTRFLPVSHEGHGIETYVDKLELLGKTRAEFISRKLKGIERRGHMSLFREMVQQQTGEGWQQYFENKFDKPCTIPDSLCIACWNCSLFGGLEAGKGATFSRVRYFDTYSVEDATDCIAMEGSEEGMGIGNQVYEDVNKARGKETYHFYEYVKAGTRFPFITIIESPTLLDVAGYIHAVRRADDHGYGKYSANHGKFDTKFLVVATGYPRFSVLDILQWADEGTVESRFENREVHFDDLNGSVALFGDEIETLTWKLKDSFEEYFKALG